MSSDTYETTHTHTSLWDKYIHRSNQNLKCLKKVFICTRILYYIGVDDFKNVDIDIFLLPTQSINYVIIYDKYKYSVLGWSCVS